MERLPFRLERGLTRLLDVRDGQLSLVEQTGGSLPGLRGELGRPAAADLSLVIRVHARTGVPLAVSSVDLVRGDQAIEAPGLTLLAMEGYSHLAAAERRAVEGRVWSRRAYATASIAPSAR